ncbi:MAG: ABC transporter substrate-binding protein [Lachnospiraceae bacterium]|nr:ABC transporter substrate-binding protein [Lachnospiraceae bacterium]
MKKRFASFVALALVCAMTLAACGGGGNAGSSTAASTAAEEVSEAADTSAAETTEETEPAAENENVLYYIATDDASSERVNYPFNNRARFFCNLLWRSLLTTDADFATFKGDLASDYSVSDDGLTYTFTMADVKWSDGEPVTAEDVKFTFEMILQLTSINSNYANAAKQIVGANTFQPGGDLEGITVDGNTVTIQLDSLYADFEKIMSQIAIMPKHVLEGEDFTVFAQSSFFDMPVTNGMYKVEEVVPANYIIYTINEHYEGEKPQIEKIHISALSDPIVAAQGGQLDFWNTNNPAEIEAFRAMDNFTEFDINILYYRYFVVNCYDDDGNPNALMDPKVRQALVYAIDRQALVDAYYDGFGVVSNSGGVPNTPEYNSAQSDMAYDPDLAKSMLEEAGFDFSQTLRLRYYSGDQTTQNFMEAIGAMLNEIGIQTDVMKFENDATEELWTLRNYELAQKNLSAFTYSEWYGEYINENYAKVLGDIDPEFSQLITSYNTTVDAAERQQSFDDLQMMEQEMIYKLPLFTVNQKLFVNTDKIELPSGIEFGNPWYNYDMQFESWSVK